MSRANVTAFALACGAVQTLDEGAWRVSMWKEHNVYHVWSYQTATGARDWRVFHTLKKARAAFYSMARTLREGDK